MAMGTSDLKAFKAYSPIFLSGFKRYVVLGRDKCGLG